MGDRYLDYVVKVSDGSRTVSAFTPQGKFTGQDCMHLTRAEEMYFAGVFDADLGRMGVQILTAGRMVTRIRTDGR